jgi:hypothetical protein
MGTLAGRTPRGPVQLYVCRGPSTGSETVSEGIRRGIYAASRPRLYTTGSTEARLMTKYGINGNCRRKSGSTSNGMFFSSIHWRAEP